MEELHLKQVDLIKETQRKGGFYGGVESEIFTIQKRGKNNFDIGTFIDELLFRDED